jgi:hypothetical protein
VPGFFRASGERRRATWQARGNGSTVAQARRRGTGWVGLPGGHRPRAARHQRRRVKLAEEVLDGGSPYVAPSCGEDSRVRDHLHGRRRSSLPESCLGGPAAAPSRQTATPSGERSSLRMGAVTSSTAKTQVSLGGPS